MQLEELPETHWLLPVLIMLAMASCAAWLWIVLRKTTGQPLIPLSPRRPVPWTAVATLLAVIMAAMAVAGVATSGESGFDELSIEESVRQLARSMLLVVSITAVTLSLVAAAYQADWNDLGLPRSLIQFLKDGALGAAGFLVALVPVYGLQAVMVYGFGEPSQHPLITKLLQNPAPDLLAVGFLSAVIVAPICEEITFRLLLQGWLEKALSRRHTVNGIEVEGTNPTGPAEGESSGFPNVTAQRRSAVLAILGSSLVFAIAHVGHGPDPIAIFLLALILGYLYQRTHRIVPCIVTHMLFNGFSLLVLIALIFAQE